MFNILKKGLCYLNEEGKQCFQGRSRLYLVNIEHLLALRRLCVSAQNKPFRRTVIRALYYRMSKLKEIPELVAVKKEIHDEFTEDPEQLR